MKSRVMDKRILLLGGIGEALAIARQLPRDAIYSLAGLGKVPGDLPCQVRVGGYGGAEGLARFIAAEGIGLLIDATPLRRADQPQRRPRRRTGRHPLLGTAPPRLAGRPRRWPAWRRSWDRPYRAGRSPRGPRSGSCRWPWPGCR